MLLFWERFLVCKKQWWKPKVLSNASMDDWWGICHRAFTVWHYHFIVHMVSGKSNREARVTCHVTKNKRYNCKKTLKSCQKYLARAIQGVKHVTALPFLPPSKDNFLMKTGNTLISKTPEDRGMAKSTKTISYIRVLPLSSPQNKSYFNHHMLLTFLFLSTTFLKIS